MPMSIYKRCAVCFCLLIANVNSSCAVMMLRRRLRVTYDEDRKLWKSALSANRYCPGYYWVGAAILFHLNSHKSEKVLEYYYDLKLEYTAGEILSESIAVARNLWRLAIKQGDVVVLCSMCHPYLTPLALGCYMVGAIVNFFEPRLTADNLDEMLSQMRPSMVLFEEQWRSDLYASLERVKLPALKHILSINASGRQSNVRTELLNPLPSVEEVCQFRLQEIVVHPRDDVASYVFTAGTNTGTPKICKITHSQLLYGARTWFSSMDTRFNLRKNVTLCAFSTPSCISQIQMLLQSILFGVKRICSQRLPDDLDIGDYGRDIIRDTKITHCYTTPGVLANILDAIDEDEEAALKTVCILGVTGEPAPARVLETARQCMRKCKVFQCYGMTEAASIIASDEWINGGSLLPGFKLQIKNDECQPLGPGQRGQIFIEMPLGFKGYLSCRDHQKTVDYGLFLNGDFGSMNANMMLHVESRYRDVVRFKELMLTPHLIENVLIRLMEVNSACLVSYASPVNQAHQTPALFVVPSYEMRNARKLRATIKAALLEQLPRWEVDPIKHIYFLREMAVLAKSGQIDRDALRQEALRRAKGKA